MYRMSIAGRTGRFFIGFSVLGFCVALSGTPQSHAVERTWSSTSSTDFENAANWGGTAPANNLTDDTAVFDAKGALVNPSLTTDREIHAIKFTDGGWTLGGAANTLSVGAGGVNYISNSTATNVIAANIELAVDSTWIISCVSGTGNRTLQVNGVISGPGGFTKTGIPARPDDTPPYPGTMGNVYGTLRLTALNTYTGQTILDQGGMTNILEFNSIGNVGGGPSALGAPTTVENGTIRLISQVAPKYTGTGHATDRRIELAGAGGHAMLYADGSGPLVWNGDVVVTGTGSKVLSLRGSSTAANTFNGLIADGTVPLRFQIYGAGHWTLANDNNSWTGDTRVGYGTLTVTSLADAGVPSALGAATGSNALIKLGTGNYHGTLKYVGTGHSTNRPVQLGDSSGSGAGTIEANGTGALVFTGNFTGVDNGTAKTLTLGGTSAPGLLNTISGVIADGNTALGRTTSLVKSGTNTWVLSGANTYTGNTVLNAGVLRAEGSDPGTLGTGASQLILNSGTLESYADTTSTINYGRNVTIGGNTTITVGRLTAGDDRTAAPRQFGTLSIGNATLAPKLDLTTYTGDQVDASLTFGDTTLTGNANFNLTNLWKPSAWSSFATLNLGNLTDGGNGYGFTATGQWYYSTLVANGGVNVSGDVQLNGTTLHAVGDWNTQHFGGNINLAGGVLQTSGELTRPLGDGPGQIRLTSGSAGFSTHSGGSNVTVNLTDPSTGQSADLVWGSADFKPGTLMLALGSAGSSGQLEFVNAIDLNGSTRTFNLYRGVGKISGALSNSQATPAGLIKHTNGGGTLWLANDGNTFDGPIEVRNAMLQFESVGNVGGSPSSLGAPTTAANGLISLGSATRSVVLRHTGSGDSSTDRMIALPGTTGPIAITADGAGTLRFTNTDPMPTPGAGAKTLTFNGTNTGDNLFAIGIVDNSPTNTTRVVKGGAGTWVLSGANTYTGPTTVNAGTLLINGTHSGSGAFAVHSGATLGGTGTIGGATTVNSGAFLAPGASIGMVTFSNDLALQANSTLLWEFLEAGAAGDDYDSITGPKLVLPETGKVDLSISALAGYQLSAGDSFTLFHGDVFEHGAAEPFAFDTNLNDYFHVTDNIGWWGTWELTAGSLVLTAVPEPGTWLMLVCGLAFGLLVRRRR
ncbi:MAG: autotransporter-associated beta strand repeat-containing protein [Thermoguttaceae bacterium]|jgi:fibronectin-binding autotransporter adhesin|nr:autotransporter-associated beta strand repeat-containing protein [Thermoguttaceae bacterium]